MATGHWLLRGDMATTPGHDTVVIVDLDDTLANVLITNVIGDRVRIHVADNPNDWDLSPGESIVRRGAKIFIQKIDNPATAYGTFSILG